MAVRRVRLQDVAQAVGVVPSTVSRVLRGEGRCASRHTAQRIRRAAEQLGYQPNVAARALASGQSRMIGVPIGRPGRGIYTEQMAAIGEALQERGYQAVPLEYESPAPIASLLSFGGGLANGIFQGLIVCTQSEQSRADLEEAVSAGVPAVSLVETPVARVPVVTTDHRAGTYMSTRYLMHLGHTRIAAVNCSPTRADTKDTGYRQALEEEGLEPLWLAYGAPYQRPAFKVGYELTQRLLQMEERPTAAVCSNDEVAVGVIRAMRDHGLQVPQDLSVAGFDGLELTRYCVPALTTVRQPVDLCAAQAVHRLLDLIEGNNPGPLLEVLPPELVVRESCSELPREEVSGKGG